MADLFCTECGSALSEGSKFCSKCGKKVETENVGTVDVAVYPPVPHSKTRPIAQENPISFKELLSMNPLLTLSAGVILFSLILGTILLIINGSNAKPLTNSPLSGQSSQSMTIQDVITPEPMFELAGHYEATYLQSNDSITTKDELDALRKFDMDEGVPSLVINDDRTAEMFSENGKFNSKYTVTDSSFIGSDLQMTWSYTVNNDEITMHASSQSVSITLKFIKTDEDNAVQK